MNSRMLVSGIVCAALAIWANGSASAQNPAPASSAALAGSPVGTQITYQGQLQRSGTLHTGPCTFEFRLFDAATTGAQMGTTVTTTNVAVTNGIFSVGLDFGNQFTGDGRWMQTAVKCAGDAAFTTLSPRQPQNAVPYAIGLRPGANVVGNDGDAVSGRSITGSGLGGYTTSRYGVYGEATTGNGGYFVSTDGEGAIAKSTKGSGLSGYSTDRFGIYGESAKNDGVYGTSVDGSGVSGFSTNRFGIYGQSTNNDGVYGKSVQGSGVTGISENRIGVYGKSTNYYAGWFDGKIRSNVVEIVGGADLAEKFSEANGATSEPGTVMSIDADNPGQIEPSGSAYDRKVVGIVSGAGDVQPGLTLHQEGVLEGNTTMAIAGRVYVKADARTAAIKPGDLLTTSDLPGYAMTASDDSRSHGAVIGKAMTGLPGGTGLVLVIVNLQ